MKFTLAQIQSVYGQKGYTFFDGNKPFNINIIGIRSNNVVANSFDDWLYLIYRDDSLAMQMHEFAITTDPGAYWLQNPMNVNGTAILVPGQYRGAHQLGLHRGRYEALTQKAAMSVWRDKTGDNRLDEGGQEYSGIFGINIHRSNASRESQVVEKWSAGCQVFQDPKEYDFFMDCCKKAASIYGNSFTYTLLEEKDF